MRGMQLEGEEASLTCLLLQGCWPPVDQLKSPSSSTKFQPQHFSSFPPWGSRILQRASHLGYAQGLQKPLKLSKER